MSFKKEFPLGEQGMLSIVEEGGIASIKIDYCQAIDGARATVKGSVDLELSAIQLAEIGFAYLKEKFPSLSEIIGGVEAAVEAEIAKI